MRILPVLLILFALSFLGGTVFIHGTEADAALTRRAVIPLIAAGETPFPTATPTPTTAAATSTPTTTSTSTATPTRTTAPAATPTPTQTSSGARTGAVCNDGTTSTATGSGACSRHGGVAYWTY